jgi:sulfur-carrier protein adenylyltransferase/sulfurtransferase
MHRTQNGATMNVRIRIPSALKQYTDSVQDVVVAAATVGEALDHLVERHPSLRSHLFDEKGRLRNFVNTWVNEDDVRELGGVSARLQEGDTITIVPSIAGGAPATESPFTVSAAASSAAGSSLSIELGLRAEAVELNADEIRRYSRHLIMPEVGMDGQRRLKAAKVLCIGAGGLGSPLGLYLAAAGIGTIGIVDFDVVDETNLQRQVMHGTKDVGRPKIASARDRLLDINPTIDVIGHETPLTSENALEILEPYDVIVDGTDNFPTRYLVNDACVLLGKPNVYGSIFRFEGQLSVFWARQGPCYRCLFREPPPPGLVPSCAEGGVLGVLPGIVGTLQALEAIKLIIGEGDSMIGRLLLIDALSMKFRELKLRRNPDCPVCGTNPTIRGLIDYEEFCGIPQAHAAEVAEQSSVPEITATRLKQRLDGGDPLVLIDVRERHEWDICNLGPAGARLIPLGEVTAHMNELSSADEIVIYCRSGARSAKALRQLQDAGFRRLLNLKGGILAWSAEVDPSVPRY